MARQKKPVHRVQMTEGKRNIIHQLLEEYDIQSAEDIQDALKDLLGGTIKEMMEAEMDDHLGYEKSERSDNDDYRNGYKRKQLNSRYGSMEIEVPQDRKSTFEPQVVKKRQKDISDIDQKIISMYAKGMTTRQISETIEDIYGFETSESFISDVTDKILPQIEDWQNRPLDEVYPILYIDAIHYSVRDNGVIRKLAAYVILGINTEGKKEVLTISVGDNESAKYWLSVMNELKNRGVKDVLIICADGLTGIKEAIAAAFPKTEYQRCIVHQVRNTLKYVPDKDRKAFAADLKTIYQAADEKKALAALDRVTEKWSPKYPNSMKRWKDNWDAISPIFKFSTTVRTVIYTTNAIESLNSTYRKLNRQDSSQEMQHLKKMIRYIQNNYMESISLKQLSETANICEREVQRSFHNIIQQSPIQYLIHYRIEKACHMLDSGEQSIIDISNSCGFSSPSYFTKTFKSIVGCTPREYRNTR